MLFTLRRMVIMACALLATPLLFAQSKPLATWNGGKIDDADMETLSALMLLSRGKALNQLSPEVQMRARYELVDSSAAARIVAAAAVKSGITLSAQEQESDYKNFVDSSGGEAAAVKRLAAAGMTRESLMQERKTTWLMQKYLDKVVGAPAVTPAEVQLAYESLKKKSPKQLNVPDRAFVAHIVMGIKPGMSAAELVAVQNKAQEVRSLAVKPGADFAALAKQFSSDVESRDKGGVISSPFSLAMQQSKPQLKEFIDAAFKLKPGSISAVVKVPDVGFDIIKLVKIVPAHAVTLEEASPRLAVFLRSDKAQQAAANEVRRLSEAAHLEILLPVPQPAAPLSAAKVPGSAGK